MSRNKKGRQPQPGALFISKSAASTILALAGSGLRQVVTHRREYHAVDPVRTSSGTSRCAHSGPGIPVHIGVLHSKLHAALRSVVEAIPEPDGAFQNTPGVAIAIRKRSRNKTVGSQYGRRVDGGCGCG